MHMLFWYTRVLGMHAHAVYVIHASCVRFLFRVTVHACHKRTLWAVPIIICHLRVGCVYGAYMCYSCVMRTLSMCMPLHARHNCTHAQLAAYFYFVGSVSVLSSCTTSTYTHTDTYKQVPMYTYVWNHTGIHTNRFIEMTDRGRAHLALHFTWPTANVLDSFALQVSLLVYYTHMPRCLPNALLCISM